MKPKRSVEGKPPFWVKLMGVFVAIGIIVVLIFSGLQNVIEQMSELQRDLDAKNTELQHVSDQLVVATSELESTASELKLSQAESDAKTDEMAQLNQELAEISAELADTTSDKAESDRQLSEKTGELASSQNRLSALRGELGVAQSDADRLRSELSETQSQLAQVNADLEAGASELKASQSEVAARVIELDSVQVQLVDAVDESKRLRGELAEKRLELEVASIIVTESHTDLYAFNWAYQIASCVLSETVNLAAFLTDENREFSSRETARYLTYQTFITDRELTVNGLREYCAQERVDKTSLEIWWERSFVRAEDALGLDRTEALKAFEPYGGILVPHSTIVSYADEILSEMSVYASAWPIDMNEDVVSRLWFFPS